MCLLLLLSTQELLTAVGNNTSHDADTDIDADGNANENIMITKNDMDQKPNYNSCISDY